MTLTDGQVPVT